jgi:hypothetical protein
MRVVKSFVGLIINLYSDDSFFCNSAGRLALIVPSSRAGESAPREKQGELIAYLFVCLSCI